MVRSRLTRATIGLLSLICIGLAGSATFAAFTSDPISSSTTVRTGSLGLEAVGNALTFDSTPLAPGDVSAAHVRLRHTGSLPGTVALHHASTSSTSPGGCAIKDALALRIVEDLDGDTATTGDRREVYDGTLAAAPADIAIGDFAVDERRTFEFTFTYVPQGGATAVDNDNCFQGSVEQQTFTWTTREVGS